MLKRKLGLLVAAAVMVGMFTSCLNVNVNKDNGTDNTPKGNGIEYTDFTNYSVKVKNETSQNVVCFHNTPREGNLISGVKAGAAIGLKKNDLFTSTHDFILFVVTEDDYVANKNNLQALDRTPFATVYAYYNAEADKTTANMEYKISANMGGQYCIYINNNENYNVELRQNGLYGESLAFAGAYTTQTKINMIDGHYEIFPVFRKYHRKTGEIITSFPKYTKDGKDYPVFFAFDLDPDNPEQEFNTSSWFDPKMFNASVTPSAAYVAIHNGNNGTGVSLYKGANMPAATTSTGGKSINSGKTLTFEVPMTSLGAGRYSTSANISGWNIGTSMNKIAIDAQELEAGKMYYIEVAGNNYVDLTATWKTKDGVIVADATNFDDEEPTQFK
jgi:hypothetical protein